MSEWQPIETAPEDGTLILLRGIKKNISIHGALIDTEELYAIAEYDDVLKKWLARGCMAHNGGNAFISFKPKEWQEFPYENILTEIDNEADIGLNVHFGNMDEALNKLYVKKGQSDEK